MLRREALLFRLPFVQRYPRLDVPRVPLENIHEGLAGGSRERHQEEPIRVLRPGLKLDY